MCTRPAQATTANEQLMCRCALALRRDMSGSGESFSLTLSEPHERLRLVAGPDEGSSSNASKIWNEHLDEAR